MDENLLGLHLARDKTTLLTGEGSTRGLSFSVRFGDGKNIFFSDITHEIKKLFLFYKSIMVYKVSILFVP